MYYIKFMLIYLHARETDKIGANTETCTRSSGDSHGWNVSIKD